MSKRKKVIVCQTIQCLKEKKVIVWQTIQCLKEKRHSLTENTMSKGKKVVVWQTIQKAWSEVESHSLTDNTMSKRKKDVKDVVAQKTNQDGSKTTTKSEKIDTNGLLKKEDKNDI